MHSPHTTVAYQLYFWCALSIAGAGNRWINEYGALLVWMTMKHKNNSNCRKTCPSAQLSTSTSLHALALVQTKASVARGQWLTAGTMAVSVSSLCLVHITNCTLHLVMCESREFKCRLWGFCCSCLSLVLYWNWRSTNCHQLLGTVEYLQYCYKCGSDDQEASQGCQRAEITHRTTHTSRALRYESQNTDQLSSSISTVHRTYTVISNNQHVWHNGK